MSDFIEELALRWKRNPDAAATIALCDAVRGPIHAELIQQVGNFARDNLAGDVHVQVSAARMYLSAHRFSEAQSLLVAAGKVAPREASVYRVLGEVLLRRGDADRAEKVLERAMSFGSGDSDTRLWLDRAKVFRPMQAKGGARAVASEVERTAPAALREGRPPLESMSDSTTEVKSIPPAVEALRRDMKPAAGTPPPGVPSPFASVSPALPTGENIPRAVGSQPGPPLFAQGATPPPRYSKDANTASMAISAPPRPPPHGVHEDSVTFDLDVAGVRVDTTGRGPLNTGSGSGPNSAPFRPRVNGAGTGALPPNPRDVLDALALAGVFEPPAGQPAPTHWDKPTGLVRRRGSVFLVVMTFLFAGSVITVFHFARQKRMEQHTQAEQALIHVEAELHAGKASSLPALETEFSRVFELDSRSPRAALDWLRERALVGLLTGGKEIAFEDATTRAREVGIKDDALAFAQVGSFLFQGDTVGAAAILPKWDGPAAGDPWYQMLAGATLERAGDARALERYAAAVRLDPDLVVAQVALVRAMAIDGDASKAGELAKQFRAKYPDRAEGAALVALAWARDPGRGEQPPPEANEAIARASELPVTLAVVPHAIAAIRALDKHAIDEAKAAVSKGLAASEGPGVAAWLGSIAIATEDEALARKAALIAVSFSAVYPPARVLAARVALLGDRLDEALKATEDLEASSPDVAIVRAAAAYERADADGLGRALDALGPDARKLGVMGPLALAGDALAGKARLSKDKLLQLAEDDAPWSDLVAMDIALDYGELDTATKIAATWQGARDKAPAGTEERALRALRLSRLARYQGRLDDAETLSMTALRGGTITIRSLEERVFVLVARKKESEVGPLLGKYPLVLGPLATWLSVYTSASAGKVEEARGKAAALDAPPPSASVPVRIIAAAACGKISDRRRGPELVKGLLDQTLFNPDVVAAGVPFNLRPANIRR
ncbi:MAG: repeat protein [Myxococcaceae bacterium]|nr:repeat protein [Myxococcaceae bacterium]